MRMAVVALGGIGGHFFDWHNATLQLAAADVFELDGGVTDVKVLT